MKGETLKMETLKNFRKKSQSAEKRRMRDPLVSSGLYVTLRRRKNFYGSVPWVKWYNLTT